MLKEDIQLIITLAGKGQRFLDVGYSTHKSLLVVDKVPIIKQIIDMFPGIGDISFVCTEEQTNNSNMAAILSRISPNCKTYSIESHKKGPVYSVSQIFDKINSHKPVIIAYCDCLSYFNFDEWLKSIGDFDASLLCNRNFHPVMLGNDNFAVCFHRDNVLTEVREKYKSADRFNDFNSTGVHYFKSGEIIKKYFSELIQRDINISGEYYVSLVFNLLVENELKTNIFEVENVINLGVPYQYEEYKQLSEYFWENQLNKEKFCHSSDTTLILPMAGDGSRFKNEGYTVPKPLIDVDGLPMFLRSVNSIPQCYNRIFVIQEKHRELESSLLKLCLNTDKITVLSELTEGQACSIQRGIVDFDLDLDKPILISACDFIISYNAAEYEKLVNENHDVIAFSFQNVQSARINPENYAWLDIDKNRFLKKLYCKKFPFNNPSKHEVFMGTCFFRKARYFLDAFDYNYKNNIRTNGEFYLDDMLNTCLDQGLKVKVFKSDYYCCLGSPTDLKVYNYYKDYFYKKFGL